MREGKKKVLIISAKKNYLKAVKFANSLFIKKISVSHANSLDQARQWIGGKGKKYFGLLIVDSSIPEENFNVESRVLHWDLDSKIYPDMAFI